MDSIVSVSRTTTSSTELLAGTERRERFLHMVVRHLSHPAALATEEPVCDGSLLFSCPCFKGVLLVQLLEFFTKRCRCEVFAGHRHQPARRDGAVEDVTQQLLVVLILDINGEQAQIRTVLVVDGAGGHVGADRRSYGRTRLQD